MNSATIRTLTAEHPDCCRRCIVGDHIGCPNIACRCGREGHTTLRSTHNNPTQPKESIMTTQPSPDNVIDTVATDITKAKSPKKAPATRKRPRKATPKAPEGIVIVKPSEDVLDRITKVAEEADDKAAKKAARAAAKARKAAEAEAAAAAKALEDARKALEEARKASADRVERMKLAKEEAKALKAWEQAGSPEDARPNTPNLDAIQAGEKVAKAPKGTKAPSGTVKTRSTNPRYIASQEEARKGIPRGKGTKVSDEELEAWIAAEVKADPSLTRNQAEQISYWIERRAVGIDRFNAAFAKVTGR